MDDLVPVRLVPVEADAGDCQCHQESGHDHAHDDLPPDMTRLLNQPSGLDVVVRRCAGATLGLADAVAGLSDCNRAEGRIYRVDDSDHEWGKPGETITVYVPRDQVAWFEKRWSLGESS